MLRNIGQFPASEQAFADFERAQRARIIAAESCFLFPLPAEADSILTALEDRPPFDVHATVSDRLQERMAGFPRRHRLHLVEAVKSKHPAWSPTLEKLCGVVLRPGGCIVGLLGPRGTGKTQLAVALARYVVEQSLWGNAALRAREPVAYESLPCLLSRVRATFSGNGRGSITEARIIETLGRVRLLVLDETHEASGSDWASSLFTTIVDRRYRDCLDTVLISNEQPGGFARSVGASVADRMRECGAVVECAWESFRGLMRDDTDE